MIWTRRAALAGLASSVGAQAFAQLGPGAEYGWATSDTTGRLGASLNADQRFPVCSSFKWLLAACVLARVDATSERLDRRVSFGVAEIEDYAPAAKAMLARAGGVRGEMTVEALCDAAVTQSDNTAANLLLAEVGGPARLTAYVRTLGDTVTRLDRTEPTLNAATPGDVRDTTSPRSMMEDLRRLTQSGALEPASRRRLTDWLAGCVTGETRLRAALPPGARAGDKTGSGENGTANDVAIVWPEGGGTLLVCVYLTGGRGGGAALDAAIASIGRMVFAALV
jgi:beta-lactamase class A